MNKEVSAGGWFGLDWTPLFSGNREKEEAVSQVALGDPAVGCLHARTGFAATYYIDKKDGHVWVGECL